MKRNGETIDEETQNKMYRYRSIVYFSSSIAVNVQRTHVARSHAISNAKYMHSLATRGQKLIKLLSHGCI